ncbi:putative bifunctional diguanylate cyclase/phosphodiesterase [Streptomyces ginkgonis]|uniref:putative bifunctional diguanylate cyclase/phosphodiesterase n=1 Tax=Streptomyces ginkgonis TaxID=1812259 RepID=UPI0023DF9A8B|nr:GGDEF domain-containing phosphodiesterase [Streptomyces ginkgonis]
MQSAPTGRPTQRRGCAWLARYTRSAVLTVAAIALLIGVWRVVAEGHGLFPGARAGLGFALLTGAVVTHLVAVRGDRWWGNSGSGAALALAMLLQYGWVPALLISLAVVTLVGAARRDRRRQALVHGAIDILGVGAAGLTLAVFGVRPSVAHPWHPDDWTGAMLVQLLLGAIAYLVVSRTLHWVCDTPSAALPSAGPALTAVALVRQGMIALALLCFAPLIVVVAAEVPLLIPMFAVPLIALDRTLWLANARAEEQLLDPLTGLPNRQWLLERTRAALEECAHARPGGGTRCALVLIDLDSFRDVNDTLGHLTGDRLLLQIADRIRAGLPPDAVAARLGGDEFAVLLPGVESAGAARQTARSLIGSLSAPLELDGLTLVMEASAGVAVAPDQAEEAEDLLRRADVAMYGAKRDRSGVEVYEASRDAHTPDRLGLLGDLRHALERGEVELHYQPKVRFDGAVAGLEALIRWAHPERGRVPPDEFIAIAETSGLMPQLTEYVLEQALHQVARWRAAGLTVPVAVNVSPRDVYADGFTESVAARLARHRVPAESLQLEITEHVMLEDPQHAAGTLAELTGHGVKISLDDFGTGYSSLSYLRTLPVSELKIDRSFVAGLAIDPQNAEIVRCTIELAHSLGLVVVAEGVEDDETWERLRDMGCDAVQGWLVSAALPPAEATAWLRGRDADPPPAEAARAAGAAGAGRARAAQAGELPSEHQPVR